MVGALLPLVLAAVLSVVAVAAAGPRPERIRVPGPRLAGGAIAGAVVVGLVALGGQGAPHPGGDPGGRILAALRPAATAVPPGALVLSRDDREPSWTTCGAGRSGWSDVAVDEEFSVPLPGDELIARMDGQLAGQGWRPGVRGSWTKPVPGGARALAALAATDQAGVWRLDVTAPPEGARCQ